MSFCASVLVAAGIRQKHSNGVPPAIRPQDPGVTLRPPSTPGLLVQPKPHKYLGSIFGKPWWSVGNADGYAP